MPLITPEKDPIDEELDGLTEILVEFAHALNPDINQRECYEVIYDELEKNNLSINNAARLGILCKLTIGTPDSQYDH